MTVSAGGCEPRPGKPNVVGRSKTTFPRRRLRPCPGSWVTGVIAHEGNDQGTMLRRAHRAHTALVPSLPTVRLHAVCVRSRQGQPSCLAAAAGAFSGLALRLPPAPRNPARSMAATALNGASHAQRRRRHGATSRTGRSRLNGGFSDVDAAQVRSSLLRLPAMGRLPRACHRFLENAVCATRNSSAAQITASAIRLAVVMCSGTRIPGLSNGRMRQWHTPGLPSVI
jgi:hypothetical protein